MSGPYIGEIRMFAGTFAPAGWAFCDGQLLPISENDTLFNLIGTTYGGDGQETFALPDLQSRVPIHMGTGGGGTYILAETGGVESVTLTTQQMPIHNHLALSIAAPANGVSTPQASAFLADEIQSIAAGAFTYVPFNVANPQVVLPASTIALAGGAQPHTNIQPYLAINFIISLFGIYPSPT